MSNAKGNRVGRRLRQFGRVGLATMALAALVAVLPGSHAAEKEGFVFHVPKGLPELPVPDDNPMTEEKIELGKLLYFDPRLSIDDTISCATCHDPNKGWSDGRSVSEGVKTKDGKQQFGGRNAPTVLNTAYGYFQFWDGRAGSLEEQALGPMQNPVEMGMPNMDYVVEKLNKIDGYRERFHEVFGTDVTPEGIAKAIAAFERTALSGDAPYDAYKAGDTDALSPAAKRGMDLFFGDANCSACHSGHSFTDFAFHNIGVGMDQDEPDEGRAAISGLKGDTGSFKTPTLRDIARSAPYMHDGSMKTLEEVVQHYNKGGVPNPYLDEEIFELGLSDQQVEDLVTFMKEGLSSKKYPAVEPPELPQ